MPEWGFLPLSPSYSLLVPSNKLALLKKITDILVFGNFLIASAAVALALETNLILRGTVFFRPYYFMIFFATFFVYNLHRYIGAARNKDNDAERNAWAINNRALLKLLILLGLIGLLISLLYLRMKVGLFLLPLCVITLGYSLPVIRRKADKIRLRDLPWLKTFLIAAVWTFVTVVLPGLREDIGYLDKGFLLVCLERFLFVLAITIPFDIRDIRDDKKDGVISIAVSLGEGRSKMLAVGLLVLFLVLVSLHYQGSVHLWPLLISAATTLYLVASTSPSKNERFYLLWLDGTMIFQFMLVLAFSL